MQTMTIPIENIQVGERFRQQYTKIDELAASISRLGLIEPLVIDDQMNLIAGGRRLEALKVAGVLTATCVLRSEVDELTARELELEENIQREELTWTERAALVSEIDRLKRLKHGDGYLNNKIGTNEERAALAGEDGAPVEGEGWTVSDTAIALDVSQPTVSRDLLAARVIEVLPALADAPDRTTALSQFDKLYEKIERELAVRLGQLQDSSVHLGDCRDVLLSIPDASVDLILLDPPYGTSIDTMNQNVEHTDTHFDDSPENAISLMREIAPELARVLKPNGHMYVFAGLKVVSQIKQPLYAVFANILELHGFSPDYIPLAWIKNTAGLVEFDYRYAFGWEPILFVQFKEMRRLAGRRVNVFQYDSATSKTNLAQKPDALYNELIRMSTQAGEVVLDPTAGSGRSVVVAKQMGRKYIAIEQDKDQHNAILRALTKVEPMAEEEMVFG